MKKILLIGLCLFISFNAYAIDITNCKPNAFEKGVITKCYPLGSIIGEDGLNRGLTFYKNYADQKLDANYALGSGKAQFTNTLSNPRFSVTQNSVRINTAFSDVLKYQIQGNRTAAQETIVIKFIPDSDFANDGIERDLTGTQTKGRIMQKAPGDAIVNCYPNADDSGTVKAETTTFLSNTSYILMATMTSTGNPNLQMFVNGIQEGTDSNADFVANAWGASFSLGSTINGTSQFNGSIQKVLFFNHALTKGEVSAVTNILNN